jgi:RNA polymerase sigma-B factor
VAAPTLQSSRGPRRRRGDRRQRARAQAHERTLALRYHRHGDLAARRELVERFIPLARELALRYSYTDEPTDDLVQVASLGLLKAVDRYEPNRGSKFTSYAVPTILGELKRHFRDKGWALHMPRDLQERALAVSRATEKLSAALGRSPRLPEIAEELGCTVEAVLDAAEAAGTYEAVSLDAPVSREADEPSSLGDLIGGEDGAFSLVETREAVADTWGALPEVEREVVRLRFACDLTQREIGERIGFSQMHVSRLLRRAVGRLRDSAAQAA